jgi:MFS family permease
VLSFFISQINNVHSFMPPRAAPSSRNIPILSISLALGSCGPSVIVLLGGIISVKIAPSPQLATLPITLMVVGLALSTIPAAMLMERLGRKPGFIAGAFLGACGAILAMLGTIQSNFILLIMGSVLIGANGAFIQQYRYAAAESTTPERAGRAISYVLLGGIAAGFLGPLIATLASDWLPQAQYAGSFAALVLLYFTSALLLAFLRDVRVQQTALEGAERPLRQIASQPVFLIAVLAGATAYGVMNLIMTATPIHLHTGHGYSLGQTALIIQSHVIAMYLPSLFTGYIVERLGLLRVMLIGAICMVACVILAMISQAFFQYWAALVLLGMGWNFLFVGGTLLLTNSYRPSERFKAQATNDFTIFTIQALVSLSAGLVMFSTGWLALNLIALPFLLLILLVLVRKRKLIAVQN